MRCVRWITLLVSSLAAVAALTGCGTYAQQGAAQGAKSGMLGGAVAGAVGSLFWGGNVLQSAAVGAVATAAAGAAVGAASGSQVDKAVAQKEEVAQRDKALEERIGPDNFEAASQLAHCKHDRAIDKARAAFKTAATNERRQYALMIEAVAAEEKGDTATAAAVYPRLVEIDPSRGNADKVRSDALSGILKVQKARTDHGLRPTCT